MEVKVSRSKKNKTFQMDPSKDNEITQGCEQTGFENLIPVSELTTLNVPLSV